LAFGFRTQYYEFRNDDSVSSAGILMRKQQIAIIALALWLTIVSVFTLFTQRVDLGIFFVLSLIGMLVIVQLMQSYYAQPGYLKYIRYLIAAGIIIFGVIVALKVLDILGWEIVI
jgi:hypothetical protein